MLPGELYSKQGVLAPVEVVAFNLHEFLEADGRLGWLERLQVVRIRVLDDDLGASPRIHLHFEALVLVGKSEGIASDVELAEGDKVPGADEVVLVFDMVEGKV